MKQWQIAAVQGAACGFMLGLVLLVGSRWSGTPAQAADTPVIRAKSIELVDDLGKVRAQFFTAANGNVGLAMYDGKGKMRSQLGILNEGQPGLFQIGRASWRERV